MSAFNSNKFSRLFGLAKELNMDIEDLRTGAFGYTGIASLRSLNFSQLKDYENNLRELKRNRYAGRKKAIEQQFERNGFLSDDQTNYLIDLIAYIFQNIYQFRKWMGKYFGGVAYTERFLDASSAQKIIKALEEMRKRGYHI